MKGTHHCLQKTREKKGLEMWPKAPPEVHRTEGRELLITEGEKPQPSSRVNIIQNRGEGDIGRGVQGGRLVN